MSNNNFSIPDPFDALEKIQIGKFSFGDKANKISQVKNQTPIFAFDYISLNNSSFCFNSKLLNGIKDYQKIFEGLKRISNISYDTLSTDNAFHFHEVDFTDTEISESDFIKCLVNDINKVDKEQAPTVYQFKIFDKARIFGFICKRVFYPVLFDRNHQGYKRK